LGTPPPLEKIDKENTMNKFTHALIHLDSLI